MSGDTTSYRVLADLFGVRPDIEQFPPPSASGYSLSRRVLAGLFGVPLSDRSEVESGSTDYGGRLALVIAVVMLGLGGLAVFGVVLWLGAYGVPVGLVEALVSIAPAVGVVVWLDRWNSKPLGLLLWVFGLGLVIGVVSALLLVVTRDVPQVERLWLPLAEEAVKTVFLMVMVARRHYKFGGPIDGVVYAGVLATGSFLVQNVMYFAMNGTGDFATGFIMRGVLSTLTVVLFAVPVGCGVGIAARAETWRGLFLAPLVGYLAAAALHILWNLVSGSDTPNALVTAYFTVTISVVGVCSGLLVYLWNREWRVIAQSLPGMVQAGWIAYSEVALLASPTARMNWRRAVRRRHGTHAERAVADYQAAVTELAFLLRHGADPTSASDLAATLKAARQRATQQTS